MELTDHLDRLTVQLPARERGVALPAEIGARPLVQQDPVPRPEQTQGVLDLGADRLAERVPLEFDAENQKLAELERTGTLTPSHQRSSTPSFSETAPGSPGVDSTG